MQLLDTGRYTRGQVWVNDSFKAGLRLSNSSKNNKSIYIKKFIGTHLYGNDLLPFMCQLKFVPLTNWERGKNYLPRSFIELSLER